MDTNRTDTHVEIDPGFRSVQQQITTGEMMNEINALRADPLRGPNTMPDQWDSVMGQTHFVGDGCTPSHQATKPSDQECEFDPDHLYHDHAEADALRAEVMRLQQENTELKEELEQWRTGTHP